MDLIDPRAEALFARQDVVTVTILSGDRVRVKDDTGDIKEGTYTEIEGWLNAGLEE